jgi:tetratricopeptide (TPR) repeat protein
MLVPGHKPETPPMAVTPPAPAPPPAPAFDVRAAIAAGTLERLQEARAHGKQRQAAGTLDADGSAALALTNALLASDHGQSTVADTEEAAAAALGARPPLPARTGMAEGARALAALAAGKIDEARAAATRARTAAPELPEALFASGRVQMFVGATSEARADLEAAVKGAPKLTAARLDLAALKIDVANAPAAIKDLEALLAADQELLRARLLLAEARRAAVLPVATDEMREACREGRREGRVMRAACAFERAASARLAGDRGEALKSARVAVAGSGRNIRAVAHGVMMLATLGDVDSAGEAMRKIAQETAPGFIPRSWADRAAALARADKLTSAPVFDQPASPEHRLLVARAAFAEGGPKALGETLRKLGPAAVDYDPDLKLFATLVDEGKPSSEARQQLEASADKGSSLASYLLGRHALAAGERKRAAQRLARALQGHGDSCEAARLLLGIERKLRPSSVNTDAKVVRTVRGRNGGCVHAQRPGK